MKNILFLITKSEIGGAQRFVQEQLSILNKSEYKRYVVTNKPGWLSENSREADFTFHDGIESKLSLSFLVFLFRFLIRNDISLVICNSANAGFYGRIAAFLANTKAVYVTHGWSSVYNGGRLQFFYNFVERVLGTISQGVLCISENDYQVANSTIGINENKLVFIPNSIIPLKAESPRVECQVLKVVTVCRLDHPKRPDLLIEAVREMGGLVELTIIGGGPMLKALKAALPPNVTMEGEVTGYKDFHKFDAFALISESEGLPISALEAMSSGLALILSNVGGCTSLIDGNGVLVSNNTEDIIRGIKEVILNCNEYKSQSKVVFDKYYNLNTNRRQYLDFYESLIF